MGPKVLVTVARVWLSAVLALQLIGVAVGMPHASEKATDLAALSRAIGYSVAICQHGDTGPAHHDDGSGDGDCCQLGLCQHAHQDLAVVPTVVALAPPGGFVSPGDRLSTDNAPTGPPLAGAVSARGPPTAA